MWILNLLLVTFLGLISGSSAAIIPSGTKSLNRVSSTRPFSMLGSVQPVNPQQHPDWAGAFASSDCAHAFQNMTELCAHYDLHTTHMFWSRRWRPGPPPGTRPIELPFGTLFGIWPPIPASKIPSFLHTLGSHNRIRYMCSRVPYREGFWRPRSPSTRWILPLVNGSPSDRRKSRGSTHLSQIHARSSRKFRQACMAVWSRYRRQICHNFVPAENERHGSKMDERHGNRIGSCQRRPRAYQWDFVRRRCSGYNFGRGKHVVKPILIPYTGISAFSGVPLV